MTPFQQPMPSLRQYTTKCNMLDLMPESWTTFLARTIACYRQHLRALQPANKYTAFLTQMEVLHKPKARSKPLKTPKWQIPGGLTCEPTPDPEIPSLLLSFSRC
ncbi:hypothetical protein KP79_PYT13487 [Mizuhopecten yessoensis]|uniref:Uncharacterized protein n=1 Tax=Mizuhopecten yessoensis TaxID=6573 RepID=A0A210QNI5_MIZYE|nr:hypothetical protein KP79_PYT13487 [Mizuhopecten yessoensis]